MRTILILANKNMASLRSDLLERGWTLSIHMELKSFLADVNRMHASFAFISVDFTHPNLSQVRHLLTKVYRLTLIDFSEEQNLESLRRLRNLEGDRKIYSPLNVSTIERLTNSSHQVNISSSHHEATDPFISLPKPHAPKIDDKIKPLFQEMVNNIFSFDSSELKNKINWIHQFRCFEIKGKNIHGHMLFAWAEGMTVSETLLNKVSAAIKTMMVNAGEDLSESSLGSFEIKIQKVNFLDWAKSVTPLLEKTVYQGNEVAMAFIPFAAEEMKDLHVGLENSQHDMISLPIDEILPDQPLPFDVYIHLPLNGRFVLYGLKAGTINIQQQFALKSRGTQRVYTKATNHQAVVGNRLSQKYNQLIHDHYAEARAA